MSPGWIHYRYHILLLKGIGGQFHRKGKPGCRLWVVDSSPFGARSYGKAVTGIAAMGMMGKALFEGFG